MENRVTVSICGENYTLVAEEAPSYIEKIGGYVDGKLSIQAEFSYALVKADK